jgi:hypothetical protein
VFENSCCILRFALFLPYDSAHIAFMPKASKPQKDPARATRAKASKPELKPLDNHLAALLNPAIGGGRAAPGTAASDRVGLSDNPQAAYDAGPVTDCPLSLQARQKRAKAVAGAKMTAR